MNLQMTEVLASLGGDNSAGNLACWLILLPVLLLPVLMLPLLLLAWLYSSFGSNNVPTELDRKNLPTDSEPEVGNGGVVGNGSSVGRVKERLSNCKYLKLNILIVIFSYKLKLKLVIYLIYT